MTNQIFLSLTDPGKRRDYALREVQRALQLAVTEKVGKNASFAVREAALTEIREELMREIADEDKVNTSEKA